jgi:hypothetical protein
MRKEKLMRLVKAEIERRCDEFEQLTFPHTTVPVVLADAQITELDRRADETCFDRDTLIRLAVSRYLGLWKATGQQPSVAGSEPNPSETDDFITRPRRNHPRRGVSSRLKGP